jgi:hypothetical protein
MPIASRFSSRYHSLFYCATALLSVCLSFGLAGCKESGVSVAASASGADISGPPVLNAEYGARNPRVCAKVTHPPSVAEAAALVQCNREGMFPGPALFLVGDVSIEMGAVRAQTPIDATDDSDPKSKIYPLRGSLTLYSCGQVAQYGVGKNCEKWPAAVGGNAPGKCWQSSFGNWECTLTGGSSAQAIQQTAGPTVY